MMETVKLYGLLFYVPIVPTYLTNLPVRIPANPPNSLTYYPPVTQKLSRPLISPPVAWTDKKKEEAKMSRFLKVLKAVGKASVVVIIWIAGKVERGKR